MAVSTVQILAVNGTTLKSPAEVTWSKQDISSPNSGRDLTGTMHKDVVAQKVKLVCKWPTMTSSEASLLLRNSNHVNFSLTYFDVEQNSMRTSKFYTGDRTVPMLWMLRGNMMVKDVSFDFIEW